MAKKIPLRQCVGCGEMRGKKEMIRVLRTTENEICLDTTGKKNGRGARRSSMRRRSSIPKTFMPMRMW